MSSLKSLSKEEEEWENLSEEDKTKEEVKLYTCFLMSYNDNFDEFSWTDRTQARTILNTAMKKFMAAPSREKALSYLRQLWALLPPDTGSDKCIDPPPGWRERGEGGKFSGDFYS